MKASFLALAAIASIAPHAVADLTWISVDLGTQYREVTHAASGSLYGLSFDGVPPDSTIGLINWSDQWIRPPQSSVQAQAPTTTPSFLPSSAIARRTVFSPMSSRGTSWQRPATRTSKATSANIASWKNSW